MKNICTLVALCIFFLTTSAQTLVNQQEVFDIGGAYQGNSLLSFDKDASGNLYVMVSQQIGSNLENYEITKLDNIGNLLWDTTYDITTSRDWGTDIYYYKNYIYATGVTLDSANVCTFNTMKIKESDGSVVWRATYTPSYSGYAAPAKVRVDAAGNVYVVGTEQTGSLDYGMNLIKYNSSGTMQWKSTYDSTGYYDGGVGLVIGTYISITGFSGSGFGSWDFATATFSPSTGALHDQNRAANGSGAFSRPIDIIKDNEDNLYVLGTSQVSGTNTDLKLIKYDTACHQVWVKILGDSVLPDVAEDLDYNFFNGKLVITGTANNATGGKDILTAQYDTSGTTDWERRLSNPNPAWETSAKAVIGDWSGGPVQGNVYVAGRQYNGADFDMVTFSYDTGGNMRWLKTYNRGAGTNDRATGFFAGGEETLVIGSSEGPTDTLYFAVMYKELELGKEIEKDTNNNPLYAKGHVIIKVDKSEVNEEAVNNDNIVFGDLETFLSNNALEKIQDALADAKGIKLVKIFNHLKTTDTISISRMGESIPFPDFWATFLLVHPAPMSEITLCNSLNQLYPTIEYAELDILGTTSSTPTDPFYSQQYCMFPPFKYDTAIYPNAGIDAEGAWDYTTGKPYIKLGVFDDGIGWKHHDFLLDSNDVNSTIVKGGQDLFYDLPLLTTPAPVRGTHGTACAGLMAARRNNDYGIAGVAGGDNNDANTGCSLYGYGIIKPELIAIFASTFSAALVLASAQTPDTTFGTGLHAINHSYKFAKEFNNAGYYADSSRNLIRNAFRFSFRNKVTNCFAAGNDLADQLPAPMDLDDDWLLVVGGTGSDGNYKSVTDPADPGWAPNYGVGLDIAAPASTITVPSTYVPIFSPFFPGYLALFSGTSASAPQATGTAGLLMSYLNDAISTYKNLAPEDIEFILQRSAFNIDSPGYDLFTGYGRLNAGGALNIVDTTKRKVRHIDSDSIPGSISSVQKIDSNLNLKLLEPERNMSGRLFDKIRYKMDVYKVTCTVPHNIISTDTIVAVWPRSSSSFVYPLPSFDYNRSDSILIPREHVYLESADNGNVVLSGYTYLVKDVNNDTIIGWLPMDTIQSESSNFAYTLLIGDSIFAPWDSIISSSISLSNEVYSVKTYPNPFDSWQVIELNSENTISEFSIHLYTINGMLMKKIYQGILPKENSKVLVDNSDLSSGIYIYLLEGKGYNKQFLKTVKL